MVQVQVLVLVQRVQAQLAARGQPVPVPRWRPLALLAALHLLRRLVGNHAHMHCLTHNTLSLGHNTHLIVWHNSQLSYTLGHTNTITNTNARARD